VGRGAGAKCFDVWMNLRSGNVATESKRGKGSESALCLSLRQSMEGSGLYEAVLVWWIDHGQDH